MGGPDDGGGGGPRGDGSEGKGGHSYYGLPGYGHGVYYLKPDGSERGDHGGGWDEHGMGH